MEKEELFLKLKICFFVITGILFGYLIGIT